MAENITLNTGSGGDTVAADEIATIKYPRSKLVFGGDGVNRGDVDYDKPLPVQIHTDTNSATALLPAAAALGDSSSNPTTTRIGAHLQVFDGTNWQRARGDATNGVDVDVTRLQGGSTITTGTVTVSTSATAIVAANASRKGLIIYNNGSNTVFIGKDSPAVTTSSGLPIPTGAAISFETVVPTAAISGIVSSGSENVRFMEW